ncbi:MAG TPA: hypothetical protein VM029_11635 [Opitutaceae bacterium]|nr:hypothetical protein [Opitutaceae bacterium]
MRPLKPYAVALSGFIAAVFSALFFGGAPFGGTSAAATTTVKPLQQAERLAATSEVAPSRDARPDSKAFEPDAPSGTADFSCGDALRVAVHGGAEPVAAPPERMLDQRSLLLVGVIELRI